MNDRPTDEPTTIGEYAPTRAYAGWGVAFDEDGGERMLGITFAFYPAEGVTDEELGITFFLSPDSARVLVTLIQARLNE